MADVRRAALTLLERGRGQVDELRYRATAVVDRIALRQQLPAPVADECRRSSRYVAVRDGTQLAVDLYRPARGGLLLEGPLPAVWTFDRYHRARVEQGRLRTRFDRELGLDLLCRHGYVVCIADVRGSGASFGTRPGLVTEHDRWDAHDITEWLAAEPWSNGRIGMFGRSFMGMTQLLAASTAPPHLVAIVPEKTLFDLYAFAHGGGVFRHDYAREWGANVALLDRATTAAPVDEDADGALRARAAAEHDGNRDVQELFAGVPFRDSVDALTGRHPHLEQSPDRHRTAISASGVAILQLAGWNDMWPRDALQWHRNLTNPRRLLLGPWWHTGDSGWHLVAERLRWFDHWLKGIDRGMMREPPIRYFTAGAPRGTRWRSAACWPLPDETPTRFHLAAAVPGAAARTLRLDAPGHDDDDTADECTVDYAATSGTGTRWTNGYGRAFGYRDMAPNDERGLSYTSAPLLADLEVTGHPVVCLWISATAPDIDLFVYLEEVRRNGYAEYVTEGVLRASHRAEHAPPHDHLGLPYHRGCTNDCAPLPAGEVACLRFDLHPLSRVFRRGRRIRLTVTGADRDNALTPVLDPPPLFRCHRSARHPSHVVLPVIPAAARTPA